MNLHVTRSQHQLPNGQTVFQITYRFEATEEEQALSRKYPLDQEVVFEATGKKTSHLPLLAEYSEQYKTPAAAEYMESTRTDACNSIASDLKQAAGFGGEEEYLFSCDPSYD